ncbi:MAG: hypothetical protein DRI34_04220 [Deltaproteobacteria bacterium]|nr:MAG: hypothetical protein DRI34_04220 [Deltaproteobacteria bacterium]
MLLVNVLGAGCVANDNSLAIYRVLDLKIEQGDQPDTYVCVIDPGQAQGSYCDSGTLDFDTSFWNDQGPFFTLWISLVNYLPENSNVDIGQLNTNDIRLERIEVRYRWEGTTTQETMAEAGLDMLKILEDSSVVAEIHVSGDRIPASSDGINPTEYYPVEVIAIPPDVGTVLSNSLSSLDDSVLRKLTLTMYLRAVGTTVGGTHVESADYRFPIGLCNGCLNGMSGCYPGQNPYTNRCLLSK